MSNINSSNSSAADDLRLASLSLDRTRNDGQQQQEQLPQSIRSPRSSSTYTSNINADIHAKLLAFQEQRQSKPGSNASSPLQEQNAENLGDREEDLHRYQRGLLQSSGSSQQSIQYQRSQQSQPQQVPQPLTHTNSSESGLQKQQPSAQELLQNISLQRQRSLNAKKNKPLPPLPPTKSPVPNSPSATGSSPLKLQLPLNDRLNPTRPAPALPVNSHVSPQVAARFPKQKQSLSQRRGMKLPGGLPSMQVPVTPSTPSTKTATSSSTTSSNNETVEEPAKRSSVSSLIDKQGKLSVQQSNQLKGLFANYADYIDIKSGSLNFQDKLSLDSNGVNFQSGQHFSISAKDLELIEELGRGNYGTVTKVLHRPSNVVMAMKEVRLELDDSKFRQILMELQVLHNCESPYIVDFFGAFFVEGAVYMCIEYMDAGSLDKIYGPGVDEPHLAYITKSVIKGLKELKEKHNIIHRDVKPTNILVNSSGKVKLCDFGVSGNLVASLAKTNIGCQSYMAPERIKSLNPDDVRYSVQSDIWSLGLTILETAKGSYPYPPETYDNIFSQLSAIVEGPPPELPESFSAEARDFVHRCLDKIPERRPNYSQLLEHPWLNRYSDEELNMDEYVQERIRQADSTKDEENAKNFEELNRKLRTPALHRGGAPTK